jgi:hypothetical protein
MNDFIEPIDLVLHRHHRTVLKAVIMTITTAIAVVIFTESYWKASWIGLSVLILSLFTTWRRYLEPLCLFVFVLAMIFICVEPNTLTKVKSVLLRN